MKHNQMRQVVFPILAAFIWGTSFVSQDICADSMGAFTFNGTRYFIAVLSLLVVIAVMNTTRKDRPQPTAEEKKAWIATQTGVTVGSDAFFPFGDNVERARKSGAAYIAEPGGSIRDDHVIATADKYNMTMCFTGMRLFHH